jgi:hypothetical protein
MNTIRISGKPADAGQLDSRGKEVVKYIDGPHKGHTATVRTDKYNCGAWSEEITCSCDAKWENAMNGCWQQGHQREEWGDATLSLL